MVETKIRVAKELFEAAILRHFDPKYLKYSFLTGSYTFTNTKNDIDCVVVLDDRVSNSKSLIEKIIGFSKDYIQIHKDLGQMPDWSFPGDVLSHAIINDALNGRGYDVINDKLDLLPIDTSEGYLNEHLDFRVYNYELITHKDGLITGNSLLMHEDMVGAMRNALLFVLAKPAPVVADPKEIYKYVVRSTHLDDRYYSLAPYYAPLVNSTMRMLEKEGFVETRDGTVFVNANAILNWEQDIMDRIENKRWVGKHLFGSWEVLRKAVDH